MSPVIENCESDDVSSAKANCTLAVITAIARTNGKTCFLKNLIANLP
jgi:hypothetical protein